ncbi:type I polyketide synthase [Amycolatopsis sp. EV170708-02-1]|uniref:type I polyketide synthase n=1 Tax=Amycolatopsis sp. EV170708-02-1 TaxID=2919322 RepID=UPI001F0BBB6E|nr:type I polyketide synthase [Amycolatopsis sp. EV170708-02-1]UMP03667.1 SDR family oxidoreductase [Amycolatopsis sp. EV170708-02-1]
MGKSIRGADASPSTGTADLLIAVHPFGVPSARFAAAATRAGALGVLDLTSGNRAAREELDLAGDWLATGFGVRVAGSADLPAAVHTVLLAADARKSTVDFAGRRVLAEVTSRDEAVRAVAAGADGLVARGHEAGGRIGELGTFVFLQQLLADPAIGVPVWAYGGIGAHTAAAAVAGGAAGVVLDTAFALLPEAELPSDVTRALEGLDGSETIVDGGVRRLRRLPVEAGQDAFLPERFRDRWGTLPAAIHGVRASIAEGLTASGGPLPLAQGPMTRVSDRPEFARAVAAGGALPFLALALSGPEQTREMLEATKTALGDAPWGVGVLGFAAEDVRAAQLEVIREIRPSHAIIAGGRPAQAKALEEDGISTFLHVPSPGLLRQFLEAGARKFVFEGSECGGHVGPRASFPLWEAQIDVLRDYAAEVEVYFAGGVHDERSAAMVTAAAAPLTRLGATAGLVMGTAYLFTEEAVRAGAVLPLFQRQVVEATRTDLLETAPGHATRCVRSAFTTEYAELKRALKDQAVPDREAWERLEKLNVGRLRLASKGIERVGDTLGPVAEDRQLAEGMFMAGDVAVLRSEVTTIARLHEAVGPGAQAFLAARAAELLDGVDDEPVPEPLDIAIVGMAGVFPQAGDLAAFWANILSGADSVTEVPARRWDPALYYAPDGDGEKTPSRWGGFLPEIPFDPLDHGIPPASLASIEPVQLLALEVSRRALADAGYAERAFDRSRTSVVFGAEAGSDLSNAMTLRTVLPSYLGELPADLDRQLPRLTEDSFPGVLANVIAGRVANRLDLGGANYTVDAACASSLTAVDVACKELVTGTSDLVLCGGADLHNGINDYLLFSSVHALSPSGRSATFDSDADGIALGEGVACVVLKRLADAERDGDRVYAVIKGVGSASDGRALGLTAPRPEGQYNALTRAYRNAGISPSRAGLVEAHGTGTVVGDRTELATLTKVFAEAGAEPGRCALGSVKSQIGHTKCAAGLAGLIKASLALHTGVKPPTLHLEKPNPAWDPETSPFAFHTEARPWADSERVAGVSAFGFGGTNFHVVLTSHEGAVPPAKTLDEWPAELFLFAGDKDAQDLLAATGQGWRLRDLAFAASRRAESRGGRTRFAILASTVDGLASSLRRAIAGERDEKTGIFGGGDGPVGEIAFLFPGQGSQRPGMFAELFVAFPELRRYLARGGSTVDVLFPPAVFDEAGREAQRDGLTDTRAAQPALGIVGLAAHHLLGMAGVRPSMVAGHSYGELVALTAAGALSSASLLELSRARAAAILGATGAGDPGTMAAVAANATDVTEVLAAEGLTGSVVTANRNSPEQTVISGPTAAVGVAVDRLRARGVGAKPLSVACAFHSPMVAPAETEFARVLGTVTVTEPEIPVWANRIAAPYPAAPDGIRAELAAQIGAPVRFADQIEAMYEAGARTFVEAGPGSVLTRLVAAVLDGRPHRTVTLEGGRRTGIPGFLAALARLAVAGADVRTGRLFTGRTCTDALSARPPKKAGWTVDGHLVRTADGEIPATALHPPQRIPTEAIVTSRPGTDGGEALISEFLRTSREMIAAQRDVLLGYLGTDPGVRPPAPLSLPEPVPVPVSAPAPAPERSIFGTVVEVIGERTGYPVDMIEPDLDLEADLSVDSIKRAEIAGELATRLGLTGGDPEVLAKARTAAELADLLGGAPAGDQPADESDAVVVAPKRYLMREFDLAAPNPTDEELAGLRFAVVGEGQVAEMLTARLSGYGAEVELVQGVPEHGADGVFHLSPSFPDDFPLYQAVLAGGPRWLIANGPADGARGFFRTVAKEYPDTVARVVEQHPESTVDEQVETLLAELSAGDWEPVVVRRGGARRGLRMTEEGLGLLGSTGAGPAGDGTAEAEALGLDRDSVVLLVGGAKGITARLATTLASASRCRIELFGRTAVPIDGEEPEIATATTTEELRAALIGSGLSKPAEIERTIRLIESEREVRGTLRRIGDLGSPVRYHSVDMLDAEAVHRAVKEIHAEHGRLDGIVYAAGVIEDKLIAEKDPASFDRVFATKVEGASTLLAAAGELPEAPKFAVLFGSVAATLGNRGQADYAAANDALEALGHRWSTVYGRRGLTVHWGPWAPTGVNNGMVTPELMRDYARRGIELIDPEEGTLSLLRELAWGDEGLTAVTYTASGW